MIRITKVDVLALAKIMGLLGLAFGIIIAVPYALLVAGMGLLAGGPGGGPGGPSVGIAVGMGVGFLVFMPILYSVFSFISGLIGGLLLNLVLRFIGGFTLEVESADGTPLGAA